MMVLEARDVVNKWGGLAKFILLEELLICFVIALRSRQAWRGRPKA